MIGLQKKEIPKVLFMFPNLDMIPSIITFLTINTSKISIMTQFLTKLAKSIPSYLKMKEDLMLDWLSMSLLCL
jgi:hypothetical protein